METGLAGFVADVTDALVAEVAQYFGQDIFEPAVPNLFGLRVIGGNYTVKTIVTDVEGRTMLVATVFGCVAVDAAQAAHVFFRTQHGGDNELVEGETFPLERVNKVAGYFREQTLRTWYQIGNGVGEMMHTIIRIVRDAHQFVFAVVGGFPVGYPVDSQARGCGQLNVIHVGKGFIIIAYACYFGFDGIPVFVVHDERLSWV